MITLFTHDRQITVPSDNPLYDVLKEFDGKFLGVAVTEEPAEVEEVVVEPTEEIYFDSERYLKTIKEHFGETTTYALLSTVVERFVGQARPVTPIRVLERKFLDYRLAQDNEG
jgi:hypothetical protein